MIKIGRLYREKLVQLLQTRKKSSEAVFFVNFRGLTAIQLSALRASLKDKQARMLSGGERRCVAVGRGLMSSANLLMLDEPTMGVAPNLAQSLIEQIHKIKDTGISMILAEENMRFVMNLADRIYVIQKGKVNLEGDADTVIKDPRFRETYLGMQ